jgi:hypothetical protein
MLNQRIELTRDVTRFGVMRLLLGSPAFRSNGNKAGPIHSTKYESCTRSNFTLLHTKDERQSLKLNGVAKTRSRFSNGANHSNLISV